MWSGSEKGSFLRLVLLNSRLEATQKKKERVWSVPAHFGPSRLVKFDGQMFLMGVRVWGVPAHFEGLAVEHHPVRDLFQW